MKRFLSVILAVMLLAGSIFSVTYAENLISIPQVSITGIYCEPAAGEICGDHASCTIPSDAHYSVAETGWFNVTDETAMDYGEVFRQGLTYSFGINIVADEGYIFDTTVSVTINGSEDLIDYQSSFIYNDGAGIVLWTRNYKIPGDIEIDKADVVLYYPPMAGEMLYGHSATDTGRDSHVQVTKYCWYNVTEGREMEREERFVLGNTYYAELLMIPEEGYMFEDDVKLTFNGDTSAVDESYTKVSDNGHKLAARTKQWTVSETAVFFIDRVEVTDFPAKPVIGGKVKDFKSCTLPGNVNYVCGDIEWFDVTAGRRAEDEDMFKAGHIYYFYIPLYPMEGYEFTEDLVVLLNGGTDYDQGGSRADYCPIFGNSVPAVSESGAAIGDANGDDKITTADAVTVLKICAEVINPSAEQAEAADTNFDADVTTADAVNILKFAAKIITEFVD